MSPPLKRNRVTQGGFFSPEQKRHCTRVEPKIITKWLESTSCGITCTLSKKNQKSWITHPALINTNPGSQIILEVAPSDFCYTLSNENTLADLVVAFESDGQNSHLLGTGIRPPPCSPWKSPKLSKPLERRQLFPIQNCIEFVSSNQVHDIALSTANVKSGMDLC